LAAAERFWSPRHINNTVGAALRLERQRCIMARRKIKSGPMIEGHCDEVYES
jgi:hypothetical protein